MQLSVVIATHHDPLGLYLTTFSIMQQLMLTDWEWEIVIAADGGNETKWEKSPNVICLRLTGDNRTGSPQGTRDAGIRAAIHRNVLVIESHVIVFRLEEWLQEHLRTNAALSFSSRWAEGTELFTSFGYEIDWDGSFWYKRTIYSPKTIEPHRIAGFGHAAFMLDREFYLQSGGYFLEMKSWGGEEPDLNLLVWQMGREVWMIPQSGHAHYLTPGAHTADICSGDFARNFCIAAYEHGGMEYLHKVESRFGYHLPRNSAIESRRKRICEGKFGGDLNKLREYFLKERIVN